jgi:lipopolysaccharide export system protein LptA
MMNRFTLRIAAATVAVGALLSANAALAQSSGAGPATTQTAAKTQGGGGFGFSNEGGPVDITSDRSETFQQQHLTIWEGSVIAVQGGDKLQTPRLTVYFADSGQRAGQSASGQDMGRIQRMEAEGPVFFVTATQKAQGDHATYDAVADTVTMTGNVVLVQDKNVVKGEKLVIEQKTGHSTLYATTNQEKGRVRGVFYPNSAPAAAKPAPQR